MICSAARDAVVAGGPLITRRVVPTDSLIEVFGQRLAVFLETNRPVLAERVTCFARLAVCRLKYLDAMPSTYRRRTN